MMIGVDVGGTFTDVVAISRDGIRTVKVATDVSNTEKGVIQGAREAGVEAASVFNHASTHGLNAVITRRLPKIAFLTTFGHRDILDVGRVWRPPNDLTNPHWRRSFGDADRPLVPRYLRRGIRERIAASGDVLIPLDETQAREQLEVLKRCEVQGVAICLLNAYVAHRHEERLRELVREVLGPIPCSISCEVSPLAKEFARASTTVIDVFMNLIYGSYTQKLDAGLRELGFKGGLNYANCAAQLIPADVAMRRPFEIVFAGPAAGTIASAHFGSMIDKQNLICVDVGGTSCDISLVTEGKPFVNTTFQLEHDLVVNALSIEVSSIGAGGGSLVTISGAGELQVGPGSAGADPGPACYGKGGKQPAMTDACLLIGIIDAGGFAGGRMKLDPALSLKAFEELETVIPFKERIRYAYNVGANNIAEGITNIAIQHGIDPRDYSLVSFGAAGSMLLPAVLELVHAAEVIVPPHPGLFSALGLVSSDQVYGDSRSAYTVLTADAAPAINQVYEEMEARLREQLKDSASELRIVRAFDGRLVGQTWETPFIDVPSGIIDAAAVAKMIENFHTVYQTRSGNRFEMMPVQGVTYRVEAVLPAEKVQYPKLPKREGAALAPTRSIELKYLADTPIPAFEYARVDLRFGDEIAGPAIIREPLSTTFMLPGQSLRVGEYGEMHIRPSKRGGKH
ncbi:MAG: hydantoinase/oxoprolinase family protein [Panacagrimonas sp.]